MNEQRLIDCVREGRSMHAILISGPEGSGKTALARRAAAAYCFGTDAPERLETCPDYYEIGDLPIRIAFVYGPSNEVIEFFKEG